MNRQDLQARWNGEEVRIRQIVAALKAGEEWTPLLGRFHAGGVDYGPVQPARSEGNYRADLRGIPLENLDLSRVRLDGADLESATFFKVIFCDAILSSEARNSNFVGASFIHCDLKRAKFRSAHCRNAHFGHCDLSNVDFSDATLDQVTFRASTLHDARLVRASLRDVDFVHSDVQRVIVSPETAIYTELSTEAGIRLEAQALRMDFDRFQFANQQEALRSAATIYSQLADAGDLRGLAEWTTFWRSKERKCLQLALRQPA